MTVIASSTTNGAAYIENLTTGKVVSQALSVTASQALCEQNAEWIVEDFQSCTSSGTCAQVPFANFGAVTFSSAYAAVGNQLIAPGTASGLQTINLYQNSSVLTNCAVSGATVACQYV